MAILNSFVNDIFERIATEASSAFIRFEFVYFLSDLFAIWQSSLHTPRNQRSHLVRFKHPFASSCLVNSPSTPFLRAPSLWQVSCLSTDIIYSLLSHPYRVFICWCQVNSFVGSVFFYLCIILYVFNIFVFAHYSFVCLSLGANLLCLLFPSVSMKLGWRAINLMEVHNVRSRHSRTLLSQVVQRNGHQFVIWLKCYDSWLKFRQYRTVVLLTAQPPTQCITCGYLRSPLTALIAPSYSLFLFVRRMMTTVIRHHRNEVHREHYFGAASGQVIKGEFESASPHPFSGCAIQHPQLFASIFLFTN